jgi:hypothetical protein
VALPRLTRSPPPPAPVPYGVHALSTIKKKKKLRSPDHACLASRDAEKLIVRRDLSRSLIHLSTENEPEELLQRVHRYSVPRLRCFFHSRSAPSLACIASTHGEFVTSPAAMASATADHWPLYFSAAQTTAPSTCSQACTLQAPTWAS